MFESQRHCAAVDKKMYSSFFDIGTNIKALCGSNVLASVNPLMLKSRYYVYVCFDCNFSDSF